MSPQMTPDQKAVQFVREKMEAAADDPMWRDFLGIRPDDPPPPRRETPGGKYVREAFAAAGYDENGDLIQPASRPAGAPDISDATWRAAAELLTAETIALVNAGDAAATALYHLVAQHLQSGASVEEILATAAAAGVAVEAAEVDEEEEAE